MKTKTKDALYCGARKDVIKDSKPIINERNLSYLYLWIKERYNVHLNKDIYKKQYPWTKDEIISKYRFTNVRREHDKETKWIIKNICLNDDLNYKNKLLNIILFRLFNKSRTIKIFGLIDFNNFNEEGIMKKLEKFKNKKYIYFSNAFYTSGPKRVSNLKFPKDKNAVIKMIKLVRLYDENNIVEKIKNCTNQKQVFEILKSCPGIGNFLAYQMFVDFTYIKEFPFSENEFVVAGPGCKNGLKLIFEDFDKMNYEESLFWIRDNQFNLFKKFNYNPKEMFSDLPESERYLNLMSLENCMCEFSKYLRAINSEGRPKILYKN